MTRNGATTLTTSATTFQPNYTSLHAVLRPQLNLHSWDQLHWTTSVICHHSCHPTAILQFSYFTEKQLQSINLVIRVITRVVSTSWEKLGTWNWMSTATTSHFRPVITPAKVTKYLVNKTFQQEAPSNKVSSVIGRDDSWPATVPSVVPSYSLCNWHHLCNVQYQVSSVIGRDDSWPATVPSVVPSYSLRNWHHLCNVQYQVSSVIGRNDSWPATVPSVAPSILYSL